MHESLHPLQGFERDATHTNGILLRAPSGFNYELAVFAEPYATVRWRLWRDDKTHGLSDYRNKVWDKQPVFPVTCAELSSHKLQVKHSNLLIELDYSSAPHLTIFKTGPFQEQHKTPGAIRGAGDLLKHKAAGHHLGEYQEAKIMYKDLPHQSLMVTDRGIAQYSLLHPLDAVHFGLGEKAAPLDLTKRRFTLGATDAANYDSFQTDPLYKHHPLLFTVPRPPPASVDPEAPPPDSRGLPPAPLPDENGEGFAILQFNNSNADGVWDLGRATNEPLGRFKRYTCDRGGLECFLIFGKDVADVSDIYAQLVGAPRLPSRHWLGYLASSMALADSEDPPAQTLLEGYPAKCKEEDIPCSVMHLSSGYTVSMSEPKNRYVFTFNTDRYPDFKGMIKLYHKAGIKISPNIKPFVLKSHPAFPKLYTDGAFFTDPEIGDAATTRIWSAQPGETEEGCWLDMTSRAARDWWYHGCRELALAGCDSLWNDNNEFSLASDHYLTARENDETAVPPIPIGDLGRLTNCTIMAKTSDEALTSVAPNHRTMVLTRSANISTMRYASSTWSGDNYTSWDTIRGNVAMGLQAGMALMHSYGHDVGGFGGPLPTMEMFVRWVQICVWNPRFCIHSFKPDLSNLAGPGMSNTPWMFPEVTHIIRACIKRRYELIPYLYSLHWEGQRHATPPNAWIGWGVYERDPGCFTEKCLEGTSFWIGVGRLLVAGVYRAGQRTVDVYLPRDISISPALDYFYQIGSKGIIHSAGETVTVETPIDNVALFAHVGTALPVGKPCVTVTAEAGPARTNIDGVEATLDSSNGLVSLDDWRGLEIFPPAPSMPATEVFHVEWTEDDGESNDFTVARCAVDFSIEGDQVVVTAQWLQLDFKPLWDILWIILPPGDNRRVKGAIHTSVHKGQDCFGIEVQKAGL